MSSKTKLCLALFVAGCLALLTPASATLPAADRIVLIQSATPGEPPEYLGFRGGRGRNHLRLIFRAKRKSPMDEWLLHAVRPDIVTFQSRDPFYQEFFLNTENAQLDKPYKFVHPTLQFRRQPPDDEWKLEISPSGLAGLHLTIPDLQDAFLTRDPNTSARVKRMDPEVLPITQLRILELGPKP